MEWQVSVEGRSIWLPRRNWASEFKNEGAAIQTAEFSLGIHGDCEWQSPCTICVVETGKERMSGDTEREDVWLYSQACSRSLRLRVSGRKAWNGTDFSDFPWDNLKNGIISWEVTNWTTSQREMRLFPIAICTDATLQSLQGRTEALRRRRAVLTFQHKAVF